MYTSEDLTLIIDKSFEMNFSSGHMEKFGGDGLRPGAEALVDPGGTADMCPLRVPILLF